MLEKRETKQELISSAFFCHLLVSVNKISSPQIKGADLRSLLCFNESYRINWLIQLYAQINFIFKG